jgi:transposase InsO family protein
MYFENCWLARYPRPIRVIHDQGPEFTAPPFQAASIYNGIQPVPITAKNPQANAVCKGFSSTIKYQLLTIFHSNPPQDDIGVALDDQLSYRFNYLRFSSCGPSNSWSLSLVALCSNMISCIISLS